MLVIFLTREHDELACVTYYIFTYGFCMNKDLEQLIIDYATKGHSEISGSLIEKSKDNLVSILLDLLTIYYNDVNSSAVRELVVAKVAGYQSRSEKLGYNGFRQNVLTGVVEQCEIKPRNYRTDSTAKNPKKLNGGGSLGDYSWRKFKRHQEDNPNMLVAGFVNGCLIYIFGFSFNEQGFTSRLQEQLEKKFPGGIDAKGDYLQTASFTFKHYRNAESLETIYTAPMQILTKVKSYITGPVFNYLEKNAK